MTMEATVTARVPAPAVSLVLLPSLGTTVRVWDDALSRMTDVPGDVLRFDLPGHGDAPVRRDFDVEDLADEVAARIADETEPDIPVIVAGVSMGGAIAVEIARRHPRRVEAFAAFGTALRFGSPAGWTGIIRRAEEAGTPAFDREDTLAGWFTPAFSNGRGARRSLQIMDELSSIPLEGYVECCRALARYDASSTAPRVTTRGVVVAGIADRAVPASHTMQIAATSSATRYQSLDGAHLAVVEDARQAARILRDLVSDSVSDLPEDHVRAHF